MKTQTFENVNYNNEHFLRIACSVYRHVWVLSSWNCVA